MALLGNNRHYLAHRIQRRHFNSTTKKVGYELPAGFSEKVADQILVGLLSAARQLETMSVA